MKHHYDRHNNLSSVLLLFIQEINFILQNIKGYKLQLLMSAYMNIWSIERKVKVYSS